MFTAGFGLSIRRYLRRFKKINVIGCYSVLNYVIIVNISENIKKHYKQKAISIGFYMYNCIGTYRYRYKHNYFHEVHVGRYIKDGYCIYSFEMFLNLKLNIQSIMYI